MDIPIGLLETTASHLQLWGQHFEIVSWMSTSLSQGMQSSQNLGKMRSVLSSPRIGRQIGLWSFVAISWALLLISVSL